MSLSLGAFIFGVWLVWIAACSLERQARGESGLVSVLPGIPVFPLFFWGMACLLDLLYAGAGVVLIGGFHVVHLVMLAVSILNSLHAIRRNERGR